MQVGKAISAVLASGILLAAGCGNSAASKANAERNAQRSEEMFGTPAGSSSTASYMPVYSGTLTLDGGKVQTVPAGFSGPITLRVLADAKQQVSFGLVPKGETGNYTSPKQVGAAMERVPCGSGGTGKVTISCELKDTDKNMMLVVADMRESSAREMFNSNNKDAMANRFNSVSIDIFATIPAAK